MKRWCLMCCLLFGLGAKAQLLIGHVYGLPDSVALAGATIQLPNQLNVQSDVNGLFKVDLPKGTYLLKIKYLGYQELIQTITLPSTTPFKFYLQPTLNALQEIEVHTGYQTLAKQKTTGSFQTIGNKELNEQFSSDVLSRLEAVASGLTIDRRSNTNGRLMVRGLSTLDGNKSPLIILDNFPYQGSLDNLNPNDIESISVLKDAAATSIWGSRAGNGVIVLSSKKAIAGQPLSLTLNSNISIVDKPDLVTLRQMESADFIAVEQFLYDKGFYNSKINSSSKPVLSPYIELVLAKKNGKITDPVFEQQVEQLKATDVRKELSSTNYQTALKQQYALSLSGAEKKVDWKVFAGFDHQLSALAAESSRLSLNTSNTFRLTNNLQMDLRATYTSSKAGNGKAAYTDLSNGANLVYPYLRLRDENGTPLAVPRIYANGYLNSLNKAIFYDWNYYPATDYLANKSSNLNNDLLANIALSYKVFKGLKAQVHYQYERQETSDRMIYGTDSYTVRNLVNTYTQVNSAGVATRVVPMAEILDHSEQVLNAYNLRTQLDYDRSWQKHGLNFLAGWEINENQTEGQGNRIYGYNDENLSQVSMNLATLYPNYITKSQSYISTGQTGLSSRLNRFVSLYSNLIYSFNHRYLLSASARKDASNLYGLKTNDKWKPLWSIGAGWLINEEPFYKISWLPQLKLRASYGFSGNVDLSKSAVTTIVYSSNSIFTQSPGARFNQFGNPDLKWENVGTINIGVDFSLKNNRLSGSIEVYQKKAVDLYGSSPIDFTAVPASTLIENVASMRARGMDITLHNQNTIGALKWSTTLNFSLYKDEVLDYFKASDQGSNFVGNGNLPIAMKGYPVYSVLSYAWAGLDPTDGSPRGWYQGNITNDYNLLTGSTVKITDLVYHGPAFPSVFGTMGHTLTYKGISLTARLSYKLGYYFRRSTINYSNLFNGSAGHPDYALRWQKPGDEAITTVPSMVYPASSKRDQFYNNAALLVEKGDHIRLAYVSVAYRLAQQWLKRTPFKTLQFQANASNLGILWRANKYGLDPDYQDNQILPSAIFSMGINCTF